MGKRKRDKKQDISSKIEDGGQFAWVKLKNCAVLWPVQILAFDGVTTKVYIKSDDAEVKIGKYDVDQLFPGDITKLKKAGIDHLMRKKKPSTLRCFENDLVWAQYENSQLEKSKIANKLEADVDSGDSLVEKEDEPVENEMANKLEADVDSGDSLVEKEDEPVENEMANKLEADVDSGDSLVEKEDEPVENEMDNKLEADVDSGDSLVEDEDGMVENEMDNKLEADVDSGDSLVEEEDGMVENEVDNKLEADVDSGDSLVEEEDGMVENEVDNKLEADVDSGDSLVEDEDEPVENEMANKLEADVDSGDSLVEDEDGMVENEVDNKLEADVDSGDSLVEDEDGMVENEMDNKLEADVDSGDSLVEDEDGMVENEVDNKLEADVDSGDSLVEDEDGMVENEVDNKLEADVDSGDSLVEDEDEPVENEMANKLEADVDSWDSLVEDEDEPFENEMDNKLEADVDSGDSLVEDEDEPVENEMYNKLEADVDILVEEDDEMVENEMDENTEFEDDSELEESCSDSDRSEIFPMLTVKKSLPSEDILSDDSSVDEDCIIRDVKNPEIYISRVMKNSTSKTGQKKKHDRVHNSYQFCGICKMKCSNFSQHISRNAAAHAGDPEIRAINEENNTRVKKKRLTALRGKFNHMFNMTTIQNGKGEIILERRPTKDFNLDQYGPCTQCFLWIAKALLKKHQTCCSCRDSAEAQISDIDTIGSLVTRSDSLSGRIKQVASKRLINETFPKMRNDKISETAKNDTLIVQLGNQWMEKNVGNQLKRGVYTSQIMRLAGRFLINLRQLKPLSESSEVPLWDYLHPKHFEILVQAALLTCSPAQDDENNWAAPSNALKLGYDLKRMCNGKIGLSIMNSDQQSKEHASNVLQLMQLYWVTRVSKAARVMLEQRRYESDKHLPDPDDIITLNHCLKEKIEALNYKEADRANFRNVAEVIQAKLVMYNRRRSGELQALTLRDYGRRQTGESGDHLVGELSNFERRLLRSQEVISIRGKLGRMVPVIIPKELQAGMSYLTHPDVRAAAGVATSNPYVFASQGQSIVWAYDSVKKVCEEAGLKYPERITSTNLRKYMATMTQVLDLKTNEFQWVLNHLGHTMDVHKIHYRATSDVLERTQVAKLLMLQDQGRVGEFRNQSLEDIQFEDVVPDSQSPEQTNVEEDYHQMEDPSFDEVLDQSENFYGDIEGKQRAKPKNGQRRVWSPEEEEEIKALFTKFFDLKKRPKPKDCMKAIKKSRKENGWIQNRKKDVLKKKVFRMIDKLNEDSKKKGQKKT